MLTPTSASGGSITMGVLADKMTRGGRLTMAEQNLVVTNATKIFAAAYGPSPEDFHLRPQPLPENVKGALAYFSL